MNNKQLLRLAKNIIKESEDPILIFRQIGENLAEVADKLKRSGTNVLGGNNITPDYIEKKRKYAIAMCKQAIIDLERMK
jgi:hypothetical protein